MSSLMVMHSYPHTTSPLLPINRQEAIARCQHLPTLHQILRMNGIPVRSEREQNNSLPGRRYRVLVFQYQIVKVWIAESKSVWLDAHSALPQKLRYSEITDQLEEAEMKRVVQWAVRSLYAAGLDAGMVEIAAMSEYRQAIVDIKVDGDSIKPYAGLLNQMQAQFEQQQLEEELRQSEVVLGADPEFALRDRDGNMGFASRYVGRTGGIGYDTVRCHEKPSVVLHPLAELRPKPSADPNEVFVDMYKTMRMAAAKRFSAELEWIAGGMPFAGYPIGGHIHFSGVAMSTALARKLDTYLALPLMLLEDEGCKKRRPRYGFFGDVRAKDYGGFEYRTLPSWLVTPRIAKGVLALAKVIASNQRLLKAEPLRRIYVQAAYYKGDKNTIRPVVRELWRELSRLPLYATFIQSLDPFFAEVMAAAAWPAEQDIRPAWKLPVPEAIDDVDAVRMI